jgi:hypothetical protein
MLGGPFPLQLRHSKKLCAEFLLRPPSLREEFDQVMTMPALICEKRTSGAQAVRAIPFHHNLSKLYRRYSRNKGYRCRVILSKKTIAFAQENKGYLLRGTHETIGR